MRRIGLLGGTFDPPHRGHTTVALDVKRALDLDEVWLIPAAVPPHKRDRELTTAALRLAMVEAAVEDIDGLVASDVELRRGGVSYTVETLRALRSEHPEIEFVWILGVDQFREFALWREPEEVARLARLAVMARDGEAPPDVAPGTGITAEAVQVTRVDVSSTEVRRRVGLGEALGGSVAPDVEALIREHGLYRD